MIEQSGLDTHICNDFSELVLIYYFTIHFEIFETIASFSSQCLSINTQGFCKAQTPLCYVPNAFQGKEIWKY